MFSKNLKDSRISGCLIRDDLPDAKSGPIKAIGENGNIIVGNALGNPPQIPEDIGSAKNYLSP